MNQPLLSRRPDIGARVNVSFEFFPPKTDEMETRLWDTVKRLEPLEPHFVSVTYGAGGSTRERTARTVKRILTESRLTPAAHLTCVDAAQRHEMLHTHPGEFGDHRVDLVARGIDAGQMRRRRQP